MTLSRNALSVVTIAVGVFVAVLALSTTVTRNFAFVGGSDRLDVFFDSSASASALGSVVALVVAMTLTRTRTAFVTAGLGVVLLAAVSLTMFTGQIHVRGVAAGLILGGVVALTATSERRLLQAAAVVGAVAGLTSAGPLENSRTRYADYLADDIPQTYLLIALLVLAVLLVVSTVASAIGELTPYEHPKSRLLAVGVAVTVAGLVLHWLFVRSVGSLGSGGAMESRWLLGIAVVPLLIGAAFALPRTTGAVVLAALAYLGANSATAFGISSAVVFVVVLLVGAVLGWRRPSPIVGLAVLAVVAATGIFSNPPLEVIHSAATIVALPFALGLVFVSLLPTEAPIAVMAVTIPITVSVPIVAEFGWTAYTPLTSIEPKFSPTVWAWTSTGVSVVSVLAALAALLVLRKRDDA